MKEQTILKEDERLDDLQYKDLYVIQNATKYCFTSDAVELANFVKVKPRDNMVDLCSGCGVVGILAMAKGKGRSCVLVELQEWLADMANRSLKYNNLENIHVVCDKLQGVSDKIGKEVFDVVSCNPPYKKLDGSKISDSHELALCKHEVGVTLEEVILEASKLLKYGGRFYIVQKASRLADIMWYCRNNQLEPKRLKIVPSNKGMPVVLIEAVKGAKMGLVMEGVS